MGQKKLRIAMLLVLFLFLSCQYVYADDGNRTNNEVIVNDLGQAVGNDTDDYVDVNTGDLKTEEEHTRLAILTIGITLVFAGFGGRNRRTTNEEQQ